MLMNVVANLMNVLRMKQENDAWVANLHNIHVHCMCFSLSYICQPLSNEFIFHKICTLCPYLSCILRNVNTNASESLQISYNHYKCIAYNKSGL